MDFPDWLRLRGAKVIVAFELLVHGHSPQRTVSSALPEHGLASLANAVRNRQPRGVQRTADRHFGGGLAAGHANGRAADDRSAVDTVLPTRRAKAALLRGHVHLSFDGMLLALEARDIATGLRR